MAGVVRGTASVDWRKEQRRSTRTSRGTMSKVTKLPSSPRNRCSSPFHSCSDCIAVGWVFTRSDGAPIRLHLVGYGSKSAEPILFSEWCELLCCCLCGTVLDRGCVGCAADWSKHNLTTSPFSPTGFPVSQGRSQLGVWRRSVPHPMVDRRSLRGGG